MSAKRKVKWVIEFLKSFIAVELMLSIIAVFITDVSEVAWVTYTFVGSIVWINIAFFGWTLILMICGLISMSVNHWLKK